VPGAWDTTVPAIHDSSEARDAHREALARIRRAGEITAQQRKDDLALGVKEDGQKVDEAATPTVVWDELWMLSRMTVGFEPRDSWWGKPVGIEGVVGLSRWRWRVLGCCFGGEEPSKISV